MHRARSRSTIERTAKCVSNHRIEHCVRFSSLLRVHRSLSLYGAGVSPVSIIEAGCGRLACHRASPVFDRGAARRAGLQKVQSRKSRIGVNERRTFRRCVSHRGHTHEMPSPHQGSTPNQRGASFSKVNASARTLPPCTRRRRRTSLSNTRTTAAANAPTSPSGTNNPLR